MPERVVILFAYHFPPENSVGGARPFRFYKYLRKLGYRCYVITAAEQAASPLPDVEYVPDFFGAGTAKGLPFQVERAIRRFLFPGVLGTGWSYRAAQAARRILRLHANAEITIISTFPPLGTLFAGWQLARSSSRPWIADFRDPLTGASVNRDIWPYQRRIYEWLERFLLRQARLVIANTDAAAAIWKTKYPARSGDVHLIWNGFDPEDRITPLPLPARERRVLAHVGELYLDRNATPILESIRRLIDAGRLSADGVCVQLVGPMRPDSLPDERFLTQAQREGWLDLRREHIPQIEARRLAQTADALLLIQPQSKVQVPGKLFEYIQIGRPILAFIPRDTPIERILEKSGIPYKCAYAGEDHAQIDRAIAEFFTLPPEATEPSPWFSAQFDGNRQTETLDALIRSLHP